MEEVLEPIPYKRTTYDDMVDKIKDLEHEDYFNYPAPYYMKTVLNSDKACLKKCEELLAKMRQKGKL